MTASPFASELLATFSRLESWYLTRPGFLYIVIPLALLNFSGKLELIPELIPELKRLLSFFIGGSQPARRKSPLGIAAARLEIAPSYKFCGYPLGVASGVDKLICG